MSTHSVPPGWYSDPDGKPAEKYWDGNAWTKETRPLSIIPNKPNPAPKKVGIDGNEKALFAILAVALILVMFLHHSSLSFSTLNRRKNGNIYIASLGCLRCDL